MVDLRRAWCMLAAALAVLLPLTYPVRAQQTDAKKPSLSLKLTPPSGFTPLRVRALVEARDGSNDYADFYCATVEWDWDDGTVSESSSDCDPYEPGKSEIRRRFSAEHIYRQEGAYRIVFRLKQKTRQVGAATANLQVQGGASEGFGR
jgi:hypothetical protein